MSEPEAAVPKLEVELTTPESADSVVMGGCPGLGLGSSLDPHAAGPSAVAVPATATAAAQADAVAAGAVGDAVAGAVEDAVAGAVGERRALALVAAAVEFGGQSLGSVESDCSH